jgi:hypothetical protein
MRASAVAASWAVAYSPVLTTSVMGRASAVPARLKPFRRKRETIGCAIRLSCLLPKVCCQWIFAAD